MKHHLITRAIFLSAVGYSLTACGVFGDPTFSCPSNTNEGVTCLSARQIYAATNVSDRVAPNYRDGKPISAEAIAQSEDAKVSQVGSLSPSPSSNYLPPLPDENSPLPVRSPPKVMRIRVFPWQDQQGDLNAGGFMFTEVEGRQWTLGDEQVSRVQPNVITPLAIPKSGSSATSQTQSPLALPLPTRPGAAGSQSTTPSQQPLPATQLPPSQRGSTPAQQPGGAPTSLRTP